ncbi:hypothetical protein [Flavobacterium sp. AJR]|uniref:hypothetical protein n=1 Tax=Flavobacterium sp. AJR TaxID=1979369 RepID=UPI000F4FE6FA|nr:hypothetical protein [Flavobacterium sp. AJR]
MKKMKLILSTLLFLLVYQNVFCQQFNNSNILLFQKTDSVVVSNIFYRDKEFNAPLAINIIPAKKDSITGELTLPYNDFKEEKDTVFVQSKKRLTKSQITTLNNFLQNKKSFSKSGVALLGHYDIEISYYQKGIVSQFVRMSSITNKITLYREGCKRVTDNNKQEVDPCLFYGNASKSFKKYILQLAAK